MCFTKIYTKSHQIAWCLLACSFTALTASADIYEWEYIDPLQPELGKQESTTLVPDGAGVDAVPFANLGGDDLTKAYFINADLTRASIYQAQLTTADFSGADLTRANLFSSTLFGAVFTDAVVTHALFNSLDGRGFVKEQLYSTASYKAHDLYEISLHSNDLSGWDFSDQRLIGAVFRGSDLTGANFNRADTRNAFLLSDTQIDTMGNTTNLIRPDGTIRTGLTLSASEIMKIRDNNGTFSRPTPIPIAVHSAFDIQPDATLRFLLEDSAWDSTISFDPSVGTAHLAGALELAMTLDEGLTPADLLGATFDLFDWTGVTIDGAFDHIVLDPAWYAAGLSLDVSQLMTTGEVRVVPLIGDLNADGFVGIDDLNIILTSWNQSVTPGDVFSGDVDGDGFIGIADLNLVLGTWNASVPPANGSGAAIPEPVTMGLLILGGLGLISRRAG